MDKPFIDGARGKLLQTLGGDAAENLLQPLALQGVDSFERLVGLLAHSEEVIRNSAIEVLGRLEDPAGIQPLLQHLVRSDLGRGEVLGVGASLGLGTTLSESVIEQLRFLADTHPNPAVTEAAIYALGWQGRNSAGVGWTLRTILRNDKLSDTVRAQAAESLGLLADQTALEDLLACLTDSSPDVRFWVVYALGELGDPSVLRPLEALLEDESQVRYLHSVGEEAQRVIQVIRDKMTWDAPADGADTGNSDLGCVPIEPLSQAEGDSPPC